MNPIVKLFTDITDAELKEAILEMIEDEKTGTIRTDGVVIKYALLCADITSTSVSTNLFMAHVNLTKEAAFRWVSKI